MSKIDSTRQFILFPVIFTLYFTECRSNPHYTTSEAFLNSNNCAQVFQNNSKCSCIDGFQLGADGISCNPMNPLWNILVNTDKSIEYLIQQIDKKKMSFTTHQVSKLPVKSFTYDARTELIYFLLNAGPANTTVFSASINPTKKSAEPSLSHVLLSPRSIAFDWITGNLYYIDSEYNTVLACLNISKDCASVLRRYGLNSGDLLTLDPNRGSMYWTELQDQKRVIYRAGMDGSSVDVFAEHPTSSINALAVDTGSSRIYWTSLGDPGVSSSDINGNRNRTLNAANMRFIQSIDVFGDNLFWSEGDSKQHSIWSANKFSGEKQADLARELNSFPLARKISIIHPANQPILRRNPCENNKQCSHSCVLSPTTESPGFRCLCPTRIQNSSSPEVVFCDRSNFCDRDPTKPAVSISAQSDYLVLSRKNFLTFIAADSNFRLHIRLERMELYQLKTITDLVYNPFSDTIILTDSNRIYEYDLRSRNLQGMAEATSPKILSIALDELGENLFWIADDGTVTVMSLLTRQKLVLLRGLGKVCEILIIPNQRSFLIAMKNSTGPEGIVIKNFHLDGSGMKAEFNLTQAWGCITWAYEEVGQAGYILWAEPGQSGVIKAISLTADGKMEEGTPLNFSAVNPAQIHSPNSIIKFGSTTFWADSYKMNLNQLSRMGGEILSQSFLTEGEFCQARLESSKPLKTRLTVLWRSKFRTISGPDNRPCGSRNCSHVCLVAPFRSENVEQLKCNCSSRYNLQSDEKTCVRKLGKMEGRSRSLSEDDSKKASPNAIDNSRDSSAHKQFRNASNEGQDHEEGASVFGMAAIISISGVVVAIFLIFVASALFVYRRRGGKPQQAHLTEEEIKQFFEGKSDASMIYEKEGYHKPTWEIPKYLFVIRRDKPLGLGEFGEMFSGYVNSKALVNPTSPESNTNDRRLATEGKVEVTVKSCKQGSGSLHALRAFLSELQIMAYLGQHENIVSLIGAYTEDLNHRVVYTFVESCELGSLQNYLHRHQVRASPYFGKWSVEIATGMEFLSEKKIIHADLATRNIFLTTNKTAKITGLGQLENLRYDSSTYQRRHGAPIWRWMAPESLAKMEFTQKTDVWSFGITLWEIYSLGKIPYSGWSWSSDFGGLVEHGHVRLENPGGCSSQMYSVMLKCWNIDQEMRPNFMKLKTELISIFQSGRT